jgi:hypothetical protein
MLIGNPTRQPKLSTQRLRLLQSDNSIRADLNYSFDDRPWLLLNKQEVFAANYLMGPQKLSALAANAPLYRDDTPILEYQTARNEYDQRRVHPLLEKYLDSPDSIFAQQIPISAEAKIIQIRAELVHDTLQDKFQRVPQRNTTERIQ